MKRFLVIAALITTFGLMATANAQDKVYYFDRIKKKDDVKSGEITEETPAKISMKGNVVIPTADVKDVTYIDRLPLDKRNVYRKAITAEEAIDKATGAGKKTAIEGAIKAYQDAQADVKGIVTAKRHMDYKIASLTARLATEDPAQRKAAIDLLNDFRKKNAESWQITRTVQRLADLQEAADDYKGAIVTLKEMQDMKSIPEEVKATIPRRLVELYVKSKDNKEAAAQLDKLLTTMRKENPEYFSLNLLKMRLNASVPGQLDPTMKQLDTMIKDTKDRGQLAVCYNTKGSIYLENSKPKEALYEFLYVDLIYNDNKDEHIKACTELSKLFDKIRQPARAKDYAEKVEKLRK